MKKLALFLSFLLFFFIFPFSINFFEFPEYTVVLDPGHGGLAKRPISIYGDKFDFISKKYLSIFREGAEYKKIKEEKIVYDISKKVFDILKNCGKNGNFNKFKQILKKYSYRNKRISRIVIHSFMSRPKGLTENAKGKDINAPYRLFDYPDSFGVIHKGRISKINSLHPNLVVSLHLANSAPADYKGMNAVLVPPPSFFKKGLSFLKNTEEKNIFFKKSPYNDWFDEGSGQDDFFWFLNDVSIYYTAYGLDRFYRLKKRDFRGYRYNMVTWNYQDERHWWKDAVEHQKNSQYSKNYYSFKAKGKFWKRENSIYEEYRRSKGLEGFGGDNAYASNELIRYVIMSLEENDSNFSKVQVGKAYFSIWSVPLLVNAISAYIELGYLKRKKDRIMLLKHQDEIAEGLAVGIYSLLTGLNVKKSKNKILPKGKRIDFSKYKDKKNILYFQKN